MSPVIQSTHLLPPLVDGEWPIFVTSGNQDGRDMVIVGTYRRLYRLDLQADTWETFTVEGTTGIITGLAASKNGDFYLSDSERIHRLKEDMRIDQSTPKLKKSAVKRMEAADNGFYTVLDWRGAKNFSFPSLTKHHHVLVRYSGSLEKMWHIVLPGELDPIIPLLARGEDRMFVAGLFERLSVFEIYGHLQHFQVHDIPELRRRFFSFSHPFDDVYDRSTEDKRIRLSPGIWDACSHPSADAITLMDRASIDGMVLTRFHYCGFDQDLNGFQTFSHLIEGSFIRVAGIAENRVAALGRIREADGTDSPWLIAVIDLPKIRRVL